MMKRFAVLAIAVSFSGCLYTNIHAPRAYRSATPSDVKALQSDRIVTGRSCYRTAVFLFAWGDAGYSAAVTDALRSEPQGVLYDVNADTHIRSYALGLYSKICTVVSGRVGRS
jgi:hypothetical protein